MRVGITVPTYNEAGNITQLVQGLRSALAGVDAVTTVLVIDDNSPDGTAGIVRDLAGSEASADFRVELLARPAKEGLGPAYVAGLSALTDLGVDCAVQMDADLSHDPQHLPAFIAAAADHDLVVGSRYVAGGGTPDWPVSRRVLSRGGNAYARLVLGRHLTDYTGGFNLYSAEVLRRVGLRTITSTGYGFLLELKYRALRQAESVIELPIVFRDRQEGKSKLPRSTIASNLLLVPKLRLALTAKAAWPVSPSGRLLATPATVEHATADHGRPEQR